MPRNNINHLFPSCGDTDTPNIDNISGLLARLILQNQLTRLADIGCHGGALYGCGSSPSPSPCHPHPHSSHSQSHCHGNGGGGGGGGGCGCGGISATTSNDSRCQVCVHTCPNATQPYMGTNNVFVIPAAYVQQPQHAPQQQQSQHRSQAAGLAGVNLNNINLFLNALGLALGGVGPGSGPGSACGGGGGVSFPQGFGHSGCGAGMGQVNVNNGGFSCAACCNHFRV
ncbi:hypothetical protein VPNG_02025 [Cytospora leucostoma]|uniref:Uncharacterized protein n=1 Tax=Cytospora leucostoma TaxID=1230097 RepID=A0A423XHE1_9PEZI|nr:hypothetical protein VPNG_02025 [Cytospora leucostoma]